MLNGAGLPVIHVEMLFMPKPGWKLRDSEQRSTPGPWAWQASPVFSSLSLGASVAPQLTETCPLCRSPKSPLLVLRDADRLRFYHPGPCQDGPGEWAMGHRRGSWHQRLTGPHIPYCRINQEMAYFCSYDTELCTKCREAEAKKSSALPWRHSRNESKRYRGQCGFDPWPHSVG